MDCITKIQLMRGKRLLAAGTALTIDDDDEYARLRAAGVVMSAEEHRLRAEYDAHMASIEAEAQEAMREVRKKHAAAANTPSMADADAAIEAKAAAAAKVAPAKGSKSRRGPALDVRPEASADDE